MTDVTAALATPYDSPLIFRTEVRPYLYLASVGLLMLGAMLVGYFLWGPEGQGFVGSSSRRWACSCSTSPGSISG